MYNLAAGLRVVRLEPRVRSNTAGGLSVVRREGRPPRRLQAQHVVGRAWLAEDMVCLRVSAAHLPHADPNCNQCRPLVRVLTLFLLSFVPCSVMLLHLFLWCCRAVGDVLSQRIDGTLGKGWDAKRTLLTSAYGGLFIGAVPAR